MRGQFTQFGSRLLLGKLLTPEAYPDLQGVYVAMTTVLPTDADSGVALAEPGFDAGYVRPFYPIGGDYWASTGYGTFTNTGVVEYPVADSTWTGLRGYALMTDISGGDMVAFGWSYVSRVPTGYQLFLPAGAIQITMRGAAL